MFIYIIMYIKMSEEKDYFLSHNYPVHVLLRSIQNCNLKLHFWNRNKVSASCEFGFICRYHQKYIHYLASLPFCCPFCLLMMLLESLDHYLSLLFPPSFSSPLVSLSPQGFFVPQLPHTCKKCKHWMSKIEKNEITYPCSDVLSCSVCIT